MTRKMTEQQRKEAFKKRGLKLRKPKGYSGLNDLFARYKNSAAKKQLEFNIDIDLFQFLTSLPCYYCNKPPLQKASPRHRATKEAKEHATYLYNGIDRVDVNKGYIENNILTACKDCNYAKREMSVPEFISFIKNINNNFARRF